MAKVRRTFFEGVIWVAMAVSMKAAKLTMLLTKRNGNLRISCLGRIEDKDARSGMGYKDSL